jgi:hypothetical protein
MSSLRRMVRGCHLWVRIKLKRSPERLSDEQMGLVTCDFRVDTLGIDHQTCAVSVTIPRSESYVYQQYCTIHIKDDIFYVLAGCHLLRGRSALLIVRSFGVCSSESNVSCALVSLRFCSKDGGGESFRAGSRPAKQTLIRCCGREITRPCNVTTWMGEIRV